MDFESALRLSGADRLQAQARCATIEEAFQRRFGRPLREELAQLPSAEVGRWVDVGAFLRRFSRSFDPAESALTHFSDAYFHEAWHQARLLLPEEKQELILDLVKIREMSDCQQRTAILLGQGRVVNAKTLAAKGEDYQKFRQDLPHYAHVLELGYVNCRQDVVYWSWTLWHAPGKTLYFEGLGQVLPVSLRGESVQMNRATFHEFRRWLGVVFDLDYVDEKLAEETRVVSGVKLRRPQ